MSSPALVPSPRARSRTLRVGLLGAGTVGREVHRAFVERADELAAAGGSRLELVAVAVRDLDRARRAGVADELLSDAPAHLVADPDVDVVVELMGGDEPARTLIEAALGARKAVVTANKHVLAHHGARLEAAARRTGAPLRFEAAVGGGIPVLDPLAAGLAANRVQRVRGIVNGTTNLILDEMAARGRGYAEALAGAQAAGYAEADPTADVEGLDAVNKLVILARLAFGAWLDPATVTRAAPAAAEGGAARPGITGIGAGELAGAAALDGTLRLVAEARRGPDAGPIEAAVRPAFVPRADPLAGVAGVANRIEVEAEPVGTVAFGGPGAGGAATASAVLADLLAVARGGGSTWAGLPAATDAGWPPASPDGPGRGWFAWLPGLADPSAVAGAERSAVAAGGLAVLFGPAPLAAVRACLAAALPDAAVRSAVAVYPAEPGPGRAP